MKPERDDMEAPNLATPEQHPTALSERDFEVWKLQANHKLEVWKTQSAHRLASETVMFNAVLESGQTALKAALLVNGGAAAALLALMAESLKGVSSAQTAIALTPLGWAWLMFMFGLGTAGAGAAVRYLSQAQYDRSFTNSDPEKKLDIEKLGDRIRNVSIGFGAASLLCFFGASIWVFCVIQQAAGQPLSKGDFPAAVPPAIAVPGASSKPTSSQK